MKDGGNGLASHVEGAKEGGSHGYGTSADLREADAATTLFRNTEELHGLMGLEKEGVLVGKIDKVFLP